MNEGAILDGFPAGDPVAEMLLAAARHINEALRAMPWSVALGVELVGLLGSFRWMRFPDGTILNEVSVFDSIIGWTEAGQIVAAIDPEGHDWLFWKYRHSGTDEIPIDWESPERKELARKLVDALTASGIEVEPLTLPSGRRKK